MARDSGINEFNRPPCFRRVIAEAEFDPRVEASSWVTLYYASPTAKPAAAEIVVVAVMIEAIRNFVLRVE
jgi:hypothetical protein